MSVYGCVLLVVLSTHTCKRTASGPNIGMPFLKPPLPLASIPSHTSSQQRQFQFILISNHFKLTLLIHLTVVTKGLAER